MNMHYNLDSETIKGLLKLTEGTLYNSFTAILSISDRRMCS